MNTKENGRMEWGLARYLCMPPTSIQKKKCWKHSALPKYFFFSFQREGHLSWYIWELVAHIHQQHHSHKWKDLLLTCYPLQIQRQAVNAAWVGPHGHDHGTYPGDKKHWLRSFIGCAAPHGPSGGGDRQDSTSGKEDSWNKEAGRGIHVRLPTFLGSMENNSFTIIMGETWGELNWIRLR